MFAAVICTFLPILVQAATRIHDLPPYFPRCHINDPKISECLLKATELVKPYLIKGVPELGVPPLEPFTIPEVTLEQGTQALNFKAVLRNATVTGLGTYKFSQFDFDVPNLAWTIKASLAEIHLVGKYTAKGRLFVAPLEGSGTFEGRIKNSNVTAFQKVELYEKKGERYAKPVETRTQISVGGPEIHLDGLFGGNQELNEITNKVINDNINVLFDELKPVIEKIITNILEEWILKALEENIPFDKLYPKQ